MLAEFVHLGHAYRTGLEGIWRLESGCEMGAGGGKPCLVQVGLSTCLSDCFEALSCDQIVGAGGWFGPELGKC